MSVSLTLDDCRALAIENNINIATSQRNVDMAREQKSEAFTNYFPNISAMGAAAWFNEDLVMPRLDNFKFAGATAIQPLFMGGQILHANKLATIGIEAGEIQQEQQSDQVALTAETYFWNIV